MARAVQLFALLSAFFVVAVRCLSGFPSLVACADSLLDIGQSEICPASGEPSDSDSLAAADDGDDSDDSPDPLLAPAPVQLAVLTHAEPAPMGCSVMAAQRALPSHAPSLERPPRA